MSFVTMPVTDVRKGLNALVEKLDQPVFVTTHGRVKAVLIDIEAYNDLLDKLEDALDAADAEIRRDAEEAVISHRRGEAIPFEAVMRENGLL